MRRTAVARSNELVWFDTSNLLVGGVTLPAGQVVNNSSVYWA